MVLIFDKVKKIPHKFSATPPILKTRKDFVSKIRGNDLGTTGLQVVPELPFQMIFPTKDVSEINKWLGDESGW